MKLLLDENLSPRLVRSLAAEFPESKHVNDLGLGGRPDHEIWEAAARGSYLLVSKDDDFQQLAFRFGPPPKVLRLRIGNSGTDRVLELLRASTHRIEAFHRDGEEALLVLG